MQEQTGTLQGVCNVEQNAGEAAQQRAEHTKQYSCQGSGVVVPVLMDQPREPPICV